MFVPTSSNVFKQAVPVVKFTASFNYHIKLITLYKLIFAYCQPT